MIDIEKLKPKIIEQLKPLNPNKIILFGSYAYGTPNEDSDIDLYIVTNDEYIPKSFKDNFSIKIKYLNALSDLTDKFATDVIIHTKKMNERFLELNSSFSRKIHEKGNVLYEKS
ncbi:MAG: nucleotidyltransferase domain-containing protein [Campylobacterota bacterium]